MASCLTVASAEKPCSRGPGIKTLFRQASGLLFSVLTLIAGCGAGDQPALPTEEGEQYLVITIDVEALPARAAEDHVQRLIYGSFPDGRRAGIAEMMDIADRHGVKLTFFLDVLAEVIYPKEIESVAKLIVARGHDLQLHTHPDAMPDAFFAKLGFPRKLSDELNESEAAALFAEVRNIVTDWGIPPFIAYRAGSYRYSRGLVQAMPAAGIAFSYNYNMFGRSQRVLNLENMAIFRWENNVIEIPISYVEPSSGVFIRFDDYTYVNTLNPYDAYNLIQKFQEQWHSSNILIMMLHSWSFLDLKSGTDYFEYKDSTKAELFDRFLASLPSNVKVVSATQLSKLVEQGMISITSRMDTVEVFRQ